MSQHAIGGSDNQEVANATCRQKHVATCSIHVAHMQHTYNNNPLGIAFEKLSNMTCFRGSYDSKNAFFEA